MSESELEQYLAEHTSEGTTQSEGAFTISREEALRKLGSLQLSQEGDWLLKLVQAAVASGQANRIEIKQNKKDTEVRFQASWQLDQIEDAFFNPEPQQDRALNHLVAGLRGAAVGEGRPLSLTTSGSPFRMSWDGETMRRDSEKEVDTFSVVVSNRTFSQGKGIFLYRDVEAAKVNAANLSRLTEMAYVCPIALQVDSRRLDMLQLAPGHGVSPSTHPYSIGWTNYPGLPSLELPPASFESSRVPGKAEKPEALRQLSGELFDLWKAREKVTLGWMLSSHVSAKKEKRELQLSEVTVFVPGARQSQLLWVLDGVVVHKEIIALAPRSVSMLALVSAEGLKTDLSGLALILDGAHTSRRREACRGLLKAAPDLRPPIGDLVEAAEEEGRKKAKLRVGLGVVSLVVLPLGLVLIATGLGALSNPAPEERALQDNLFGAADELRQDLVRLAGGA